VSAQTFAQTVYSKVEVEAGRGEGLSSDERRSSEEYGPCLC